MAQHPAVHDYYKALGLKPEARQVDIERSYRKLARSWRRPGTTHIGLVGMAVIDDAYETLTNPWKKRRYDGDYLSIRRGWMRYQERKVTAAQAADSSNEEDGDLEDDDDEDEEESDGESATDDGGPDGEAVDEDFSPDEKSDDEEEIHVPVVGGLKRKRDVVEESDVSEDEEPITPSRPGLRKLRVLSHYAERSDEDDDPVRPPTTRTVARRRAIAVSKPEESETEAEFTDHEEPVSGDDVDEKVDRYADYTTVYEDECDSGSESESESDDDDDDE